MAQLLGDGDVVAAERPLEAIPEDEATDVRVYAVRAHQEIAAFGAAVAEAPLDRAPGEARLRYLGAEADLGGRTREIVRGRRKIGPAEENVTAKVLVHRDRALGAHEPPRHRVHVGLF